MKVPANLFQRIVLILIFMLVSGISAETNCSNTNSISLAGTWRFSLDRNDTGVGAEWYNKSLEESIKLPGVLQSQGYGDVISVDTPWVMSLYDKNWYLRKEFEQFAKEDEVKVPFLSQPRRHYLGAAWYQRDVTIPAEWGNKRVVLKLERCRWESTVWIDGEKIGSQDSLVAPHYFELGEIKPGRHQLTIRVDNRMLMDYRPDGHSVSDSLGSTWNGIVGDIELSCTPKVWIDSVQAYPDVENRSVRLDVVIGNKTGVSGEGVLKVGDKLTLPLFWWDDGGSASAIIELGDEAQLWSEFNTTLQKLTVDLNSKEYQDSKTVCFGLREIGTAGNCFLINGTKSQFRGGLSNGDFPLTGYPPCDVEYWKKIFSVCKEWGLNHLRYHSFCPPDAAFAAADEVGIYLQPECGMWNAISPGTEMEKRMYEETERMINEYGNHPSFVLFSPSNEPKGDWKPSLTKWVEHYRKVDPRHLYTTGTGWPLIDEPGHVESADYLAAHRVGRRPVRGSRAWFGGNHLRSMQGTDVPIIVHELGQWCAYPDFDIIEKFTGYMRPSNYEIYKKLMEDAGLIDQDKEFAYASGKLQAACYKEDIEANMRTPGLAGFQLLDLHDYLGQGTAPVGVLDAFWEEKGYITAMEWRRFCNTTVPLAVLKKRVFTSNDKFDVDIEISHYGAKELEDVKVYWKIADSENKVVDGGEWTVEKIELGNALPMGNVKADLSRLKSPAAYKLIVGLAGTEFENDWEFWVYSAQIDTSVPADIIVTRSFKEASDGLTEGKKVLLCPKSFELGWDNPPIGRDPIFWNRLMGPSWERFLGLVCDSSHPALKEFATEDYYNWQWREVFGAWCRAVNISGLPEGIDPIVQMIDGWNRNYKLAAVFECKVGKGKLVVCAADLESDIDNRPATRQLRKSLLDYMGSEEFGPKETVSVEQLASLYYDNYLVWKLGAIAYTENGHGNDSANYAIDGNPNTYWNSDGLDGGKKHPHELTIRFPRVMDVEGLIVVNRQDHRDHIGDIKDYQIKASLDEKEWVTAAEGQLESTFDTQRVMFGGTSKAKYIKIVALSGFGDDRSAAIAEVGLIRARGETVVSDKEIKPGYTKTSSATEEMFETIDPLEYSTNKSAKYIQEIYSDSESMRYPAEFAMDGNSNTFWHSQWQQVDLGAEHWLTIELKEEMTIGGIRYVPRQDMVHGRIEDYRLEISKDGKKWEVIARGKFENSAEEQSIILDEPVETQYIRLTAESEVRNKNFSAVAEIKLDIRD